VREGNMRFLPGTVPVEITMQDVLLATTDELGNPLAGEIEQLPFDFVLLCTGYQADLTLFRQLGVDLLGAEQSPRFDPETMESNVPGVFVLGTVGGWNAKQIHAFHRNLARACTKNTDNYSTASGRFQWGDSLKTQAALV